MFSCSTCQLSFKSKRCLTAHFKTKKHLTGNKETKHKCVCGKSFSYRQGLNTHKKKCTYTEPIIESSNVIQVLQYKLDKKDQEYQEMREEMKDLKKQVEVLLQQTKVNSTNHNFTIVQQGRRKINKNTRNEIIAKQDNKCNDCKNTLSLYFQVDHITALQYGGNDEFDNLQALCCECHAKKSSIENVVRDKIRNSIVDIIKTESVSPTNS
jgi:hypothetical protein